MTTDQWFDLNKDGCKLLPIFRIEVFSIDPALWLEFQWLNFQIGIVFYFKQGNLC
jgi:hypothetical protein